MSAPNKFGSQCLFYKTARGCRNGSNCPYLHDDAKTPRSNILCKWFQTDRGCTKGDTCYFRHEKGDKKDICPYGKLCRFVLIGKCRYIHQEEVKNNMDLQITNNSLTCTMCKCSTSSTSVTDTVEKPNPTNPVFERGLPNDVKKVTALVEHFLPLVVPRKKDKKMYATILAQYLLDQEAVVVFVKKFFELAEEDKANLLEYSSSYKDDRIGGGDVIGILVLSLFGFIRHEPLWKKNFKIILDACNQICG